MLLKAQLKKLATDDGITVMAKHARLGAEYTLLNDVRRMKWGHKDHPGVFVVRPSVYALATETGRGGWLPLELFELFEGTDMKAGGRVGAISHQEGNTVYLFGYGVYEGDFPCPIFGDETRETAKSFVRAAHPEMTEQDIDSAIVRHLSNPRIRLDNGKVVWGLQCWWGPEEKVKAYISGSRIEIVDIPGSE